MSLSSDMLMQKEKRDICPYNPAHSIDPLRMAIHLIKCKKQYPNVKMSVCPFNATHHVRKENLHSHISECKDKEIVEKDIFFRENPDILNFKNPSFSESEDFNSSPNAVDIWDADGVSVSYNPIRNIVYKEIPRQPPTGLGKAGRRNWRGIDMLRIEKLKEGMPIDDLMYPTPDGGEISIYEIVNGTKKREDNLPDLDRCKLQVPCPKSRIEPPKLRKPNIFSTKIAANIFEGIEECDSQTDGDNLSEISSVGSNSCSSTIKRDRQQYLELLRNLQGKNVIGLKSRENDLPKLSHMPEIGKNSNGNGNKSDESEKSKGSDKKREEGRSRNRSACTAHRMVLNSLNLSVTGRPKSDALKFTQ